ncbi:hypothetical protein LTS17_010378 [Exophiala oligosperma]
MMTKFREFVNKRHSLSLKDYYELWNYSIDDTTADAFWIDVFLFVGMKGDKSPTTALAPKVGKTAILLMDLYQLLQRIRSMYPPPIWFPELKLNFAEILMSNQDAANIVIHECCEGALEVRDVTWEQLTSQVTSVADAMRSSGITSGDRVAGVLSNRLETVVACLATLSIGAVWSTSSPDMGVEGILDRVRQIRPKILFVESDVLYNGKVIDLARKNRACAAKLLDLPEYLNMIVIQRRNVVHEESALKLTTWQAFLRRGRGRPLTFAKLPFSHPGFIVYSSGTVSNFWLLRNPLKLKFSQSGPPKCIVHSAAGLLLQTKKDAVLHVDMQPGDSILQYTTTGWIMWRNVLCGIGYGGRSVVYDGSPLRPSPLVLLQLVSKLKITHFGTSARFLTELKNCGLKPKDVIDLSCLRCVTSTGSTLNAEVSEWFYDVGFPSHVHLVSTSGGTDVASSLITGNPDLPLYAGEIQCESMGMEVDVADADADELISVKKIGKAGELICRKPFPSEPVYFWGSNHGDQYRSAYFERYGTSTWCQGDFVQRNPKTRGYIMLGRSDGVLNPSGVRFGSAEIYDVVEKIPGIADALCVGQRRPHDEDESVVLFVKMTRAQELTAELKSTIKAAIRKARTPRHVPKYIFRVPSIPYTMNGKKIELAVKGIISGRSTKATSSVANPDSFEHYKKFFEIEKEDQAQGVRAKL